jgi:hypothetical protein
MLRKNSKYRQGVYKPINKEKFSGNQDPIYRSSWELKFFRWADKNSKVVRWGSESIIVPYISPLDNRVHRYFVDNFIVFLNPEGKPKKYLIEIKPSTSVSRPVISERKRKSTMIYEQKTWVVNQAKWEAAKKWADKKGYEFIILTEKELNIN